MRLKEFNNGNENSRFQLLQSANLWLFALNLLFFLLQFVLSFQRAQVKYKVDDVVMYKYIHHSIQNNQVNDRIRYQKPKPVLKDYDSSQELKSVKVRENIIDYRAHNTTENIIHESKSASLAYYPEYKVVQNDITNHPYVYPLRERKSAVLNGEKLDIAPIYRRGVVFYVYSTTVCRQDSKYLKEVLKYTKRLKNLSPESKVALVTNCDLSIAIYTHIDVIVPIHTNDIMHVTTFQFQTRVLYNTYPPFNISLVMDAHVLFCSSNDLENALELFEQSDVELAYSTRLLRSWITSGFAVMYRFSQNMINYWAEVTKKMNKPETAIDDQYYMFATTQEFRAKNRIRFRWLSNNWFFATHGANEEGKFVGKSNCYRTSVLVNGRIRFIHGGDNQCVLMNGDHSQYSNKLRTVYIPGECEGTYNHAKLVFNQEGFQTLVGNKKAPDFDWEALDLEGKDNLFWYEGKRRLQEEWLM